mmetsp:Transcript_13135/g.39738  ORF Transcript_13135/g.39738 Transcript_13135/m.39738 type:complete len:237 (+) Transcript_13135:449-1159(+)
MPAAWSASALSYCPSTIGSGAAAGDGGDPAAMSASPATGTGGSFATPAFSSAPPVAAAAAAAADVGESDGEDCPAGPVAADSPLSLRPAASLPASVAPPLAVAPSPAAVVASAAVAGAVPSSSLLSSLLLQPSSTASANSRARFGTAPAAAAGPAATAAASRFVPPGRAATAEPMASRTLAIPSWCSRLAASTSTSARAARSAALVSALMCCRAIFSSSRSFAPAAHSLSFLSAFT